MTSIQSGQLIMLLWASLQNMDVIMMLFDNC